MSVRSRRARAARGALLERRDGRARARARAVSRTARSRSSFPSGRAPLRLGRAGAAHDPRPRLLPPARDARQARPRRVVHRGRMGCRRSRRALRAPAAERRRGANRHPRCAGCSSCGRACTGGTASSARGATSPTTTTSATSLRADARRDDDVLVRRLRTAGDVARRGASGAKYERLCRSLSLGPDDHVLEIGCGWGGFASHAADDYGCRVTGLTISREQEAPARVPHAGLPVCPPAGLPARRRPLHQAGLDR